MTANPTSSVAESASSTNDPDAQARCASDGEPSARFQSDATIAEAAVDGLLTAEEFPTERLDESVDSVGLYAEYRRATNQMSDLCAGFCGAAFADSSTAATKFA
jgi:hypothetical protein